VIDDPSHYAEFSPLQLLQERQKDGLPLQCKFVESERRCREPLQSSDNQVRRHSGGLLRVKDGSISVSYLKYYVNTVCLCRATSIGKPI
jgi:hypothetical protein